MEQMPAWYISTNFISRVNIVESNNSWVSKSLPKYLGIEESKPGPTSRT
jgi:hypothetical protein